VSGDKARVMGTWIEAYNRGDLEALRPLMHPDFQFRTSGVFPGLDPVYEGHAGFKRWFEDFTDTWESFSLSASELRDCGERALALGVFEGRGRDGVEVRRPSATVWTFREGLVLGIQNYAGWSEALEAVGLRE
jgi:ketosteroid isomerase-like protein